MTFPIRFILCETSHPGNIGATARAMKTMGFEELVLVNPVDFPSTEALARAAGATDVLAKTRVVTCIDDALAGCGLVVGASARRRSLQWPELNPRECAAEALSAAETAPVAIVFGTERAGLQNEQMDKCNALVYIPANPEYSSLNLAAAVQLLAYELHFARLGFASPQAPEYPLATADKMELFYEHMQRIMLSTGFLNPANPRNVMRKLRRLFNRARLDEHELQILRGFLAAVEPDLEQAVWPARKKAVPGDGDHVP
jgi:tRNA (cytidine32/uridine32-2'-O)-methyltransferase